MTQAWDDDYEDEPPDLDDDLADDFDYDEYVREHHEPRAATNLAPLWKATAMLLLLSMLVWFLVVIG